jgi:hypothetical protein
MATLSFEEQQRRLQAIVKANGSAGMKVQSRAHPERYREGFPFLRHGLVGKILTDDQLQSRVFRHLEEVSETAERNYTKHIRADYALRTVLLVLLWKGTKSMLESFENYFLKKSFDDRKDIVLPFDKSFARHIFGTNDGNKFFEWQFSFAPVTISEGTFRHESRSSEVLPYLKHKEIGSGAHGKVFKVKIERGQYMIPRLGSRNKDVSSTIEIEVCGRN